jgi:indolepyruvate ferredoxin oxidoreductase
LRQMGISHPKLDERIARIEARRANVVQLPPVNVVRTPYFCSGCPHNSSTKTIDGSLTFTGVGCYGIIPLVMPQRKTEFAAQMGGEGTLWIGLHRFVDIEHAFQNLGDGTYFHSGILAIRAAVASGANITYKLLYNDAVAMTGGQPLDGEMTVEAMANQVYWEGVHPITIVTDEPDKYPSWVNWPPGTTVRHRDELEVIQREMQQIKGVTAIIYDQTCAAEKRRRRKRGTFPDPQKRVFINQDVCEGCGDCNTQSNCMSVQPVDTEFGRKRRIDQSGCNKDFSCLNGFCPSFVTVHGGKPRVAEQAHSEREREELFAALTTPQPAPIDGAYNVLLTGIGGSGVLTVGAIIGMAAHLDERTCTVMDITGMAQKGGAVLSHIRIGEGPDSISSTRLWERSVDLVIGCDLVVTAGAQATGLVKTDTGRIAVNSDVVPTAQFQGNHAIDFSQESMLRILDQLVGAERLSAVAGTTLATKLLGDSIATNVFMLGYVLQKGWLPLSVNVIRKAIELNGVAVKTNLHTLSWGRVAAQNPAALARFLSDDNQANAAEVPPSRTLDEVMKRREDFLTAYQNAAYAGRYRALVDRVRATEGKLLGAELPLTEAVARYLFKLMAYKDEYEVARLYSAPDFKRRLHEQFDGDYTLQFHLAPTWLSPVNPITGKPRKLAFGAWMASVLGLLARFRGLRGTVFDVFGYAAERRRERKLIEEYRALIETLLPKLEAGNHKRIAAIAALPEMIKGFGHIKDGTIKAYEKELATRLAELEQRFANAA